MKKFLSLVLAILLFVAIPCEAFAEAPDFTAMTDEELHALIDAARNELATRELKVAENTVLFEQDGVQVYMTGNNRAEDYGDSAYLYIEVVVINDSDKKIGIYGDSASVNGWEVYMWGVSEISAGKKKKGDLELLISDASISTIEEIEDIEIVFQLHDEDEYEVICESEPITIFFNQ